MADEREVEEVVNRRRVLDEMLATQARLQEEAAIARAENERREARKEKARGKELPDLSAERFSQEMRNNGTAQQQGDWRAMVHEVRRAPFVLCSLLTTAIFQACDNCTKRGATCTASRAIKCAPCEQSHRPCSWVAAYRRWRVKEMWGVDDAALEEFGQGMVVPGPPSPRKAAGTTSRVPGVEGESSGVDAAASGSPRTIKAPNMARVVIPGAASPRKRPRPSERERLVLKVPRKAAKAAATGEAVDPPPRIIPLGPIPNTPEGVVHELAATQKQLEAAQEDLARVRASEKSYEKAVAEWKALATDLRQQVEAAAARERSAAEGVRDTREQWQAAEGEAAQLRSQVVEMREEAQRLRQALSAVVAQGGRGALEGKVAQLERRVAREYSPLPAPKFC